MKKNKLLITFLTILIVLISVRLYRLYEDYSNEQARQSLENVYFHTVNKSKERNNIEDPINVNGVIGKIEIPKIKLSYVILNKTNEKNLDISITKVKGPHINQNGNFVLAGHNMHNGTLFGRLDEVSTDDTIILDDLTGRQQTYKVYKKKIVKETDLSPLNQATNALAYLTLITCDTNDSKRLIVYAKKIQ